VSPTPKCSDQCSFECFLKAWRWLKCEPKHVADVVCSYQYSTFCVWQYTATELWSLSLEYDAKHLTEFFTVSKTPVVPIFRLTVLLFDENWNTTFLQNFGEFLEDNKTSRDNWSCHNSKARSQVADGRTASSMEGSCKYWISSRGQPIGVVLRIRGWARC
jgi:hypothetical protein